MSATNGHGDAHGGSTAAKLRRLITVYQRLAIERNPSCPNCAARENLNALQTAALLLQSAATNGKPRPRDVLADAVAIDHARRQGKRGPYKKRAKSGAKATGKFTAVMLARRQKSADFLAQFDEHDARQPPNNAPMMGPLVRRGYLKRRKEGGYVRTAKPYAVRPGAHANGETRA